MALGAGALALLLSPDGPAAPTAEPVASTIVAPPAPVLSGPAPAPAAATPQQVRIPAIGVDSSLASLGVDAAGALVPPADFAQAGWYSAGTVPGDVGPAVIAGHVDDYTGPAVFYRLEELTVGDAVQVIRSDGRTVDFRVTRVAQYPKDDFATDEVYGPTTGPELRLITCGGTFDTSRRSYRDNVVVYARSVS
ncbi:class F sortase [Modestobacter sp. DSM 44400]|uniref:class F sortase n=1 Tax=Modestobacter sp. DSM 44400 TaxID=1550230 RepID=UPI000B8175CF|nr:class F sortase [Modestobacter sp. DSM 44400]